jgi:hypothetical protein
MSSSEYVLALTDAIHHAAGDADRVRALAAALATLGDIIEASEARPVVLAMPGRPSPEAVAKCGRRAPA